MAQNFQSHMGMGGGNGQMMQQQQRQQMQQQQQQQSQGQNMQQQVQAMIYQKLNEQSQHPWEGWQASVMIQERITLIFNIVGNLRLASPTTGLSLNLEQMITLGMKFEKEIFEKSPTKDQYKADAQAKIQQLTDRRQANASELQRGVSMQAQQQAQAQAQAQRVQQMMMNQNGNMQGQVPRQMPQQPPQQGFQHLQHQMQASPIPGQPQLPMGMPTEGIPPSMLLNQQQQIHMLQQHAQQQAQHAQQQGRARQNISQQDMETINAWTNQMMGQTSPEEKNRMRMEFESKMAPAMLAHYRSKQVDPLMMYFRQQAASRLQQRNQAGQAQAQFNISQQQTPQNMTATAPPMQQQRSMNPSPMNGQGQQPPPMSNGGNQDFGFMGGSVGNLGGQQPGVIAPEPGQMGVPANGAQRNPTPQPGNMNGQQMNNMNINGQRMATNPNMTAQQQQQMMNSQASQQQQRLAQHAQQQQANARAQAAAKAQMGLQGQPGGLGPMPPQQSPAMSTLNAPMMRTPSQQMNQQPEPPQANPNAAAQFGQPLDQRFMQRGQGQQNALQNPMMTPTPEQQRLGQIPPAEKLAETINNWQRPQMNGGIPQAATMPMQGNGQMRPGQRPAGVQSTQQLALQQWFLTNPTQHPPPQMTANMQPQQVMALRQQALAMRQAQQNSLQQRNPQQIPGTVPQQQMHQMDAMIFPPNLRNQNSMPPNIPIEITKWGQLKNWTHNNPNVSQEQAENVRNLQKQHYITIMRNRVQGQPPMMPPASGQDAPRPPPNIPPGMPAPVANMTPLQNGPNGTLLQQQAFRPITPQDIQNARQHPQTRNWTNDQIREVLIKKQMQGMQQRQAQAQAQMNNMQPRAGMPPGNMGPIQNVPPPAAQLKQPPTAPEPTAAVTKTNKANPNGRGAPNPSPALPVKNLKRSSSDDVIEVPNPNPQPQRPTPQSNQGQKPTQQPMPRPGTLTSEQIAQLAPDDRKRYEQGMQMLQQSQEGPHAAKWRALQAEAEAYAIKMAQTEIPMDQAQKDITLKSLFSIRMPMARVLGVAMQWYKETHDEEHARLFLRYTQRIIKQFKDPGLKIPKDTFSITPREIEQGKLVILAKIVSDLKQIQQTQQGRPQPVQPGPTAAQPNVLIAQTGPTVPLSLENLKQQQAELKANVPGKAGSRGSHTPAAPTQSQPPINWPASSPHGAPAYSGKPPVTQENLHIPARKKQKANNSASGPGTGISNSSPQIPKTVSPELKRPQIGDSKPASQKPYCSVPECGSIVFESQEALNQHNQEVHILQIENPLQFATQTIAAALGLDTTGKPKTGGGEKMAANDSRQGATPNTKAGTPMSRQDSMIRQGSTNGSKSNAKPDPSKISAQPSQTPAIQDPWASSTIDPQDLFSAFQGFDNGLGGINDALIYRSNTPNESPESDQTAVTDTSDLSDGITLDISLDIDFDKSWESFPAGDVAGLEAGGFGGLNDFDFAIPGVSDEDIVMPSFEDDLPHFQTWDDAQQGFGDPYEIDTTGFSLNI